MSSPTLFRVLELTFTLSKIICRKGGATDTKRVRGGVQEYAGDIRYSWQADYILCINASN